MTFASFRQIMTLIVLTAGLLFAIDRIKNPRPAGTRSDRAIHQHAGQLQFDVRVTGKPAPICVSHLGVNAAEILARFLLRRTRRSVSDREGAPYWIRLWLLLARAFIDLLQIAAFGVAAYLVLPVLDPLPPEVLILEHLTGSARGVTAGGP